MVNYDAIVIGSGPAGYNCAIRLTQLGSKVAVVERDYIGGICINWGCTPSKAMIQSAKVAKNALHAKKYGINVGDVDIDFGKVAERRDKVILSEREMITKLLKDNGIDVYQGDAELVDKNKVKVHYGKLNIDGEMDLKGNSIEISGDNIVIATGSAPLIPGIIDENDPSIMNSNRLISVKELPEKLTIVGGGVIGLEFATIFSNLGTEITVVECADRVLCLMDPDVSAEITKQLESNGVRIITGCKVTSIQDGLLKGECQKTGNIIEVDSPANLIAIGRQAVVDKKGYEKVGLKYTMRGIDVNDKMQTNVDSVWSVGDATGKSILAHVGVQQGLICAENIVAKKKGEELDEINYDVIPAVVYSYPEIVAVGTVPSDLTDVKSFKVPFEANLRAAIEEHTDGFVKIWVKDNKVIAAQMIGYVVSEIIQELANMIQLGTDINDVVRIIHAHPTYAEINRTVLELALGQSIEFTG